jgi:hypothetical protein
MLMLTRQPFHDALDELVDLIALRLTPATPPASAFEHLVGQHAAVRRAVEDRVIQGCIERSSSLADPRLTLASSRSDNRLRALDVDPSAGRDEFQHFLRLAVARPFARRLLNSSSRDRTRVRARGPAGARTKN